MAINPYSGACGTTVLGGETWRRTHVSEHIHKVRLAEILVQAKQASPDAVGVALIEGLRPLARVAFTVRIARRTLGFFPFRVEAARLVIERAIRAAEKAASGEAIGAGELLAASDGAVLEACELELRHGDEGAANAGKVARLTARCVYGPEIAYGENALLAEFRLQATVSRLARAAGHAMNKTERTAQEERAVGNDLNRLLLFAEQSGDGWINPGLIRPFKERNDRGWARMLEDAGVPSGGAGKNRERWERIHQAVRRAGGPFYSQDLFGPL